MVERGRSEEFSPNECPRCGGSVVRDYQQSQEVCSKCGFVVRGGIKDRGPEWRSYDGESEDRSRGGVPVSENFYDKGMGTTIGHSTKDGKGKSIPPGRKSRLERQRKLNGRVSLKGNRGLNVGLDRIRTAWSYFSLPKGIRQRASRLYRLASSKDLVRGRSRDAFAAAALDQACREASVDRRLEDFAACLGVDFSRAKDARNVLTSELSLTPPIRGISKWVYEMMNRFEPLRDPVKKQILNLVRSVEQADLPPEFSSRKKQGIAAAIIYIAFAREGVPRSEEKVADMVGVSRTTVQNSVDKIEEVLEADSDSQNENGKEVKNNV